MDVFQERIESTLIKFKAFIDESFSNSEKIQLLSYLLNIYNLLAVNLPGSISVNYSSIDKELKIFCSNIPYVVLNSEGISIKIIDIHDVRFIGNENKFDVDAIVDDILNDITIDTSKVEQEHLHDLIKLISKMTELPAYDITPFKNSNVDKFQKYKEESSNLEFKSSIRVPINSITKKAITIKNANEIDELKDSSESEIEEHLTKVKAAIQLSFLKVLAAMLNGYGGTIRVGVADNGEVIGLEEDWKDFLSDSVKSIDQARGKYENWVSGSLIPDNLGKNVFGYVFIDYIEHESGNTFLEVEVGTSKEPVFVKSKDKLNTEGHFYTRQGTSTQPLTDVYKENYIKNNFPRRNRNNQKKWTLNSLKKYLITSSEKNLDYFFKKLDQFVKENKLIVNILNISEGILEIKVPYSKNNLSLFSINSNFNMTLQFKDLRKSRYFKKARNTRDIALNLKNIFGEGVSFNEISLDNNLYLNMKLLESKEKVDLFFNYFYTVLLNLENYESKHKY